jgi:hypothetical protein
LKILLVDGQVINDADPEKNYQYNGNATPNAEDGLWPMKELSLVQDFNCFGSTSTVTSTESISALEESTVVYQTLLLIH